MGTNNLSSWFQYHPPQTQERREAHERVNKAAMAFAEVILDEVEDENLKLFAFYAIQQARMFANQAITIKEVNSYDSP